MRLFSVRLGLALGLLAAAGRPAPVAAQSPPAASDESLDGARIFGSTCGFCHQAGGRAPGRGPKLAGTQRSDEFILNRIRVGKEGAMPAYGRAFTDKQLHALVSYIRSLKDDAQ
ncbi:MAG TPA: cytochrome c [Methylomirabilota bacterium]|jgi:mono/diheme cytochrome c family protein|nr:cytochrome c [Methylomirabilota bacterium]